MLILTWNVLHRVHGERYSEPAILRWPDEAERVRRVVEAIAKAMRADGVEAVLLQEVSGDVLSALRAEFTDRAVLNHRYPRVPVQKGPKRSVEDASEHLVVVAAAGSTIGRAHTFPEDPGKGFVLVNVPGSFSIASTHVSWGPKGEAQLATLGQLPRDFPALCVGGDFNADRQAVAAALGAAFEVSQLPEGAPRTRPQDDASGGADIDHLLGGGVRLSNARVLEHHGLSDHRPVVVDVT